MPFHSEFWLLAGTVAPVLVVASTIGIGQALELYELPDPEPPIDAGLRPAIKRGLLRIVGRVRHPLEVKSFKDVEALYAVAAAGLILNASALAASLGSLASKRDLGSPMITMWVLVLAMISLAVQTAATALHLKRQRSKVELENLRASLTQYEAMRRVQMLNSPRIAGRRRRSSGRR